MTDIWKVSGLARSAVQYSAANKLMVCRVQAKPVFWGLHRKVGDL